VPVQNSFPALVPGMFGALAWVLRALYTQIGTLIISDMAGRAAAVSSILVYLGLK
jgi:hypothetical protein